MLDLACHINVSFRFFLSSIFPPAKKTSLVMSQANFSLFQFPQQHSLNSHGNLDGNILSTPTVSRGRVPLHGSGSSDSIVSLPGHLGCGPSISPDNSLLSPASISLYTHSSMTDSSSLSQGSPQMDAYTQLARQYQQSQNELKKINQDYGRLKYVTLFTNISYINMLTERHMRT